MKPNLFDFATKELSQDAFIAWLIAYFNYGTKTKEGDTNIAHDDDLLLKSCSEEFIKLLFKGIVKKEISIKSVVVGRQWRNIDIYSEIETHGGEKYLIIIEDKTSSSYHSDQLRRYREIAANWCKENNYQEPICIYLKTGNQSNQSLQEVYKNEYKVIDRIILCDFLRKHNRIANSIFLDFYTRLERIENSYRLYAKKIIKDWDDNDWQGFFMDLDRRGVILGWGYVPNQSGGFWNAVLAWPFWKGFPVHFQIEQGNLYFKICFDELETDNVNFDPNVEQDNWFYILDKTKTDEFPFKCAYPFVHRGKTRTVGFIEQKQWLGEEDSYLDIEKVIRNLEFYKHHIQKVAEENS